MLNKKLAFTGVAVLIAFIILSAVIVQSVVLSTGNSNVTFETNRTVISGYPGVQGYIVNVTINNVSIVGPYNLTVNLTLVKPVYSNITVEINDSRSPSGWSMANLTVGTNPWGQLFFFNNSLSFQVGSVITFRINMTTYVPTSTGWNMYVELADSASSNNVLLTPQVSFYIAGINISNPLNNTNLTTRTVNFTYYSDSAAQANCTIVVNGVANATVLATNNTLTLVNITTAENASGVKNASNITISCYDLGLGQNVTTGINFFDLDVTPPSVSLVTANNSVFNSPNITLQWAASDNLRANLTCQVFLDSQLNFSVYQSNSSAVVNLSAGEHTWSVNCTDSGFFSTTPIALFTIDLSAPSIAPLALNDTIIRNNSVVNLTFSYNESSILYVNLSLGNVSNLACTNGTNKSCSALVTLYNQSGNLLNLTMTDFGGLMTSVFTTYTVDDSPPSVVAITPLSGHFNISGLSLVVNATDNMDTSINCTFYQNNVINGSINVNGSGVFNMSFSVGVREWNASCTDDADNVNFTAAGVVVIDLSSPSISGAQVNDSVIRNNSVVNLSLNYSEINIRYVNVSGGNVTTISCPNGTATSCSALITVYNESGNQLNVSITDFSGRASFWLVNYTIDDVAPTVSGFAPADYVWSNASTQGLILNASDNLDTSLNCSFYQNDTLGGSILITGSGVFNTSFSEGLRGWNASCLDDADNTGLSALKYVLIDLTYPNLSVVTLNSSVYFNGSLMEVMINYTEQNVRYVNVSGANFTGENLPCQTNGSGMVCRANLTSPQSAGLKLLTIGITDFSGRTNVSVVTYTVNLSNVPQITVISPTDGQTITDVDGNVTFNISLTSQAPSTLKVVIDGFFNSSYIGNASMVLVNFTTVSPGTHSFVVLANDTAGNTASSSARTFIYLKNVSFNEEANDLRLSFNGNITNVTFKAPDGAVAQDGYLNASYNASLDVNISTGIVANVTFSFDASDANWNKTRSIVFVGNSSANASAVRSILGITPGLLVMFHNFNAFLNQSDYNTVAIIINQSLGGRTVFYIDSDVVNQSTVFILPQCSGNANPSVVSGISQACYTNGTLNTTLWVPHLSGGGLGDDAFVPNMSIASPLNSSVQADSVVSFILRVNESNPAQQFCNFTVINSSNVATMINTSLLLSDFVQVTNASWQYQSNFTTLSNSTYNISVQCVDLNGRIGNLSSVFNITDTTPPSVSDAATSVATTTATITWNTHERANESINISGTLHTDSDSNVNATSHSLQVTGLTASTAYNYVIVSCDLWSNCNNSVNGSFTTSAAAASGSSSSGGGGGGSGSGLMSGSSISRIWSSLPIGFTDFSPDSAAISVSQVRFNVNAPQTNVYFALSDLGTTLPGSALQPSGYAVYRYIDISPTNLDQNSLSQVTITFRVERSWITGQGLQEMNVVLLRWASGKWTALPTQRIGANATTATYRADTPGFSTFAIAATRPAAAQPQAAAPPAQQEQQPPELQPAQQEAPAQEEPAKVPPSSGSQPGLFWAITGVVILIIVAAYFFINRKQEKF